MKKLSMSVSVILIVSIAYAQDFSIPEMTIIQKHNRCVVSPSNIIPGISYAKSLGKTAEEYSTYVGNLFKTTWNRENGFNGLVNGFLSIYESSRREQDPPMEILEQSDSKIVFKWKINHKYMFDDGPVNNVTYNEFNQWFEIVSKIIAEYLDATYEQKITDDDWFVITIAK